VFGYPRYRGSRTANPQLVSIAKCYWSMECKALKGSRQPRRAPLVDALAPEVSSSPSFPPAFPLCTLARECCEEEGRSLRKGGCSGGGSSGCRPVWNCGCAGKSNCSIET